MKKFCEENIGMIIGACLGLLFAVLVLVINLWRTLFIVACIAIGAFIGSKSEIKLNVLSVIKNTFNFKK